MLAVALEWIYENVTSGSVELAESYRLKWAGDREQSIGDLIRAHTRYAAMVGFMTGCGGILSAPIAAPLNLSSVIVIQVRMIAAIAHLRGYALTDPKVKTLVFICLTDRARPPWSRSSASALGRGSALACWPWDADHRAEIQRRARSALAAALRRA